MKIQQPEFEAFDVCLQSAVCGFGNILLILKECERYQYFEVCEVIKQGLEMFNERFKTNFSTSTDQDNINFIFEHSSSYVKIHRYRLFWRAQERLKLC